MKTSTEIVLNKSTGWQRAILLILIAAPVITLLLNAVSLLKYGVDMPYWDDWRQFDDGSAGLMGLHHLFTPANDTLYPIGIFLDSLAIRLLDGNSVAYQFISLSAVLGTLTFLQWKLISICTDNKWIQACAFSSTLLMLQPDSYWGLQNMAYHQAIPVVCLLWIIYCTLNENIKKRHLAWSVFAAGTISGLTYISGAFAALAISVIFVLFALRLPTPMSVRLKTAALALAAPAIATTAAQIWVIVGVQHGTHLANVAMAYPWQADFWFFLLGKIGRALLLPSSLPTFSFVVTVVITAIALVLACRFAWTTFKRTTSLQTPKTIITYVTILAVVAVYLLLIAAGRTNIRGTDMQAPLEIFQFGFLRFHFFWVTIVWPWLAISLLTLFFNNTPSNKKVSFALVTFAIAVCVGSLYTPLMAHSKIYKNYMSSRLEGLKCLQASIQRNSEIQCQQLYPADMKRAINNAKNLGASFTRPLVYLPAPMGSDAPPAFFKYSGNPQNVSIVNAKRIPNTDDELILETNQDPNIEIITGKDSVTTNCRAIELTALLQANAPETSQLYYMPAGTVGLSEANSLRVPITQSSGYQQISFMITSSNGFQDHFRFDPISGAQHISIKAIEMRCRDTKSN